MHELRRGLRGPRRRISAAWKQRIRENTPYEVTRATMVVEGLCPDCVK